MRPHVLKRFWLLFVPILMLPLLGAQCDPPGWTQVFVDDFNGTSLSTCWGAYEGIAGSSNTLWDPSHVTVHDGVADIDTSYDPAFGRWTSGGMSSAPCQKRQYGRYEVRFKMAAATGVKYAILMWPSTAPWPCGGEIDFAEDSGGNRDHTVLTVHYCDAQGNDQILPQQRVSADFTQYQTIGIEWGAGYINWLLNGQSVGGVSSTHVPSSVMEFDIQNETVGVDGTTPAHVHCLIDWVAIYRPS